MTSVRPPAEPRDEQELAELGYTSHFRRDMSLWANFALGFTYLSPVVGIYVSFAISLAAGGPPMIWALVIAGIGQLLVALVFGEVVAQFPVAGGIYPWARRLWGKKWAWMTGWVYMLALYATIAALAYGAGPYVTALLGIENTVRSTILLGITLLAIATLINLAGTKALSIFAICGFVAELIGALAVGAWLLLTERHHGLGVLFESHGAEGNGTYIGAFLAAALIGVYQYYGFEACGDVAEEVRDPSRRIPKAMRMTIYVGGSAASFVALAFVLSITDFTAVISGENPDPINTVLQAAFGSAGSKVVLAIVLLSFISGALSLQAAASRLTYSYARDRMIIGSSVLARFDDSRGIPQYALLLSGFLPAAIVVASEFSVSALTKILSFATFGIYLGFQMVVFAALRARLKGWRPSGAFTLGRWGLPVNVAALLWGVAAIVNIAWPRTPAALWIDNYIVIISAAMVIGVGLLYMLLTDHAERDDAPAGDAIPARGGSATASPTIEEETVS